MVCQDNDRYPLVEYGLFLQNDKDMIRWDLKEPSFLRLLFRWN